MAQLNQMSVLTVEDLEESLGVHKFGQYVADCEARFENQITGVVKQAAADLRIQAIFVSGPTSSGKTTFARRLASAIASLGRRAEVISLDDYYNISPTHFDAWGRPDFESIDTLDTDLMVSQFTDLLNQKRVSLPQFNFVTRSRSFPDNRKLTLQANDLIIVEGLHGLHESIAGQLPRTSWLGVFIMPWCSLLDGRQLLGSRDLRILRRISRDVVHRGSTALSTLDYWPMIDRTEQEFFPAYLKRADIYINSCLDYEFCIIAPKAYHQILISLQQFEDDTLPGSIYLNGQGGYADLDSAIAEARFLATACQHIPMIDHVLIPPESILHEFI